MSEDERPGGEEPAAQTLDALFAGTQPTQEDAPVAASSDPQENDRLCALVSRVSRGEQKALAELYDATVARVYGLARGITRNQHCAEEVTEDVYWQVWRQALRYDRRRAPVIAWLLTLARSRALDHLRRGGGSGAPVHAEVDDEAADPSANPSVQLAAAQRDRHLVAALERLEPVPKQLLSLAFYRGLTHEEISAQTRLPLGTVKSHIRRALATLRTVLGPREEVA